MDPKKIVIIGASGAIGSAFLEYYSGKNSGHSIYAISRTPVSYDSKRITGISMDIEDEASIKAAATCCSGLEIDILIIATGVLHADSFGPEKTYLTINKAALQRVMSINVMGPALVLSHFLPLLNKRRRSVVGCLSARVGSILDNKLGGWYSYRASKAALNMWIKTVSIELKRRNKQGIIVSLHPGTVDSFLSKPFQTNVKDGHLFSAEYSVSKLVAVLESVSSKDSGKLLAWDGTEIPF